LPIVHFIDTLDRELLLLFNGSDSLFLDRLMLTATSAMTWLPLYLALFFLVLRNHDTLRAVAVVVLGAAVCLLLTELVSDVIAKPLVGRWRPSTDPVFRYSVRTVGDYRERGYGFFSSHAANTFGIFTYFAWLVRRRLLTVSLLSWTLLNAWSRLYLGVHYPGDVFCGLLWGALCGTAAASLTSRLMAKYQLSVVHAPSSMTRDVRMVVCVLLLTYLYIVLRAFVSDGV